MKQGLPSSSTSRLTSCRIVFIVLIISGIFLVYNHVKLMQHNKDLLNRLNVLIIEKKKNDVDKVISNKQLEAFRDRQRQEMQRGQEISRELEICKSNLLGVKNSFEKCENDMKDNKEKVLHKIEEEGAATDKCSNAIEKRDLIIEKLKLQLRNKNNDTSIKKNLFGKDENETTNSKNEDKIVKEKDDNINKDLPGNKLNTISRDAKQSKELVASTKKRVNDDEYYDNVNYNNNEKRTNLKNIIYSKTTARSLSNKEGNVDELRSTKSNEIDSSKDKNMKKLKKEDEKMEDDEYIDEENENLSKDKINNKTTKNLSEKIVTTVDKSKAAKAIEFNSFGDKNIRKAEDVDLNRKNEKKDYKKMDNQYYEDEKIEINVKSKFKNKREIIDKKN